MTDFEKPEIQGWFIPRVIPHGNAPDRIRQQWVNVPLPLRYDRALNKDLKNFLEKK